MEDYCIFTKRGKICVKNEDDASSSSAFNDSRKYFVERADNLKSNAPFRLVQTCKVQGQECFRRSIKNASVFIILFLIASFMLNFFHELFHYSMLVMIGVKDVTLSFSASMGFTGCSMPSFDDPSIPWIWWYIELMGPLLIVNFSSIVFTMILIHHDEKNPPFDERTSNQTRKWLWKNFLKAIAYTSAFTILANTIFSPFYKIFYSFIGMEHIMSDFELAWLSSIYMEPITGTWMRTITIITTSSILIFTIMFVMLYNRREMGN